MTWTQPGSSASSRVGVEGPHGDLVLAQHLDDALGEAGALGDDGDAPAVGDPLAQVLDGAVGVAAEGLGVGGAHGEALVDVVVLDDELVVGREGRQRPPRPSRTRSAWARTSASDQ